MLKTFLRHNTTHDVDKIVIPFPLFCCSCYMSRRIIINMQWFFSFSAHTRTQSSKHCHSLKMNRFYLNRFGFVGIADEEKYAVSSQIHFKMSHVSSTKWFSIKFINLMWPIPMFRNWHMKWRTRAHNHVYRN